jgi:hypothetical protein
MTFLEQSFAVVTVLMAGALIWIVQRTPEKHKHVGTSLVLAYLAVLGLLFLEKVLAPGRAGTLGAARWIAWILVLLGCLPAVALLGDRRHLFAYVLAWLLPGLGHLYLGKKQKAWLFLTSILGLYLVGLAIGGFRTVGADDNPYYYAGKFGSGVTMLCAWALGAEKPFPTPTMSLLWFDPGLLYVAVAGLLNLVVALNVFLVELPESRPAGGEPAPPPPPPPPQTEEVAA